MDHLIALSRLQFAVTAMYHFIFVPLTLGLAWLLVIMEGCYVATGKEIYKDMTKFWGKLFGINFAIGVTTGLTMEFQFGTNWAYYSHYVGDIFGTPLAIEGLMAFFLESTFVGMFFLSWERVSKKQHLLFTTLVAIGSNFSALWILVANGWMQNPLGTTFNPVTMRMELSNFWSVLFNPVAQAKFLHTVTAGYVTGSIFVLTISAYYILKRKNLEFAKRSFKIAALFGLCASIAVIFMGDKSGLYVYNAQPTKLAAIEGVWNTTDAPAPWSLLAWPDNSTHTNLFSVNVPYLGSLILTHGLHGTITGINQLEEANKLRIINGQKELVKLQEYRKDPRNNAAMVPEIEQNSDDIGYGLLLKQYTTNVATATPAMVDEAARSTVPNPLPLYYTFRAMVFLGISMFLLFAFSAYFADKGIENRTKLLKSALVLFPAPWISCWCGWFVAEYGRQPWTIYGILPTHQSASSLTAGDIIFSLFGFVFLYTVLLVVELYLMTKYAKEGPAVLGKKEYTVENMGA